MKQDKIMKVHSAVYEVICDSCKKKGFAAVSGEITEKAKLKAKDIFKMDGWTEDNGWITCKECTNGIPSYESGHWVISEWSQLDGVQHDYKEMHIQAGERWISVVGDNGEQLVCLCTEMNSDEKINGVLRLYGFYIRKKKEGCTFDE